MQIYKVQSKYTKPPVSLEGQLLWREFFYTVCAFSIQGLLLLILPGWMQSHSPW